MDRIYTHCCWLILSLLILTQSAIADVNTPRFAPTYFNWNGNSYTWLWATEDEMGHIDIYQSQAGSAGSVKIYEGPSQSVVIEDAENGDIIQSTGQLLGSGAVDTPMFDASPLFGKSFLPTGGVFYTSIGLSEDLDNPRGYSESWQYWNSDGQFTITLKRSGFSVDGSISGYDANIGAYEGVVTNGVVTINRTAPTFAPMTIWTYGLAIPWHSGWVSQEGVVTDYYFVVNSEDWTEVKISGEMWSGVAAVEFSSYNSQNYHTGQGSFDYWTQKFTMPGGEELQVQDGTHTAPAGSLGGQYSWGNYAVWVNGSQFCWSEGYDSSDGTSSDTYVNPILGTFVIRGNPTDSTTTHTHFTGHYLNTTFSGIYDGAFILDASGSPARISLDGDTLLNAPPAFWIDGLLYWQYSVGSNYYAANDTTGLIAIDSGDGTLTLSGWGSKSFSGSYAYRLGVFLVSFSEGYERPACPANADGSALLSGDFSMDDYPPAISVQDYGVLQPLGSEGDTAFYGNAGPFSANSILTKALEIHIGSGGDVTFVNGDGEIATGNYNSATRIFQSSTDRPLPMPMFGVDPLHNNAPWRVINAPVGRPTTISVNGEIWRYVGTNSEGKAVYYGYYPGAVLTIAASARKEVAAVEIQYANGTRSTGTYQGGVFSSSGGQIAVGNGDTTAVITAGSENNLTGNLDITGNLLSIGSWLTNSQMAGFTLQYTETAESDVNALVNFLGSRQKTSWLWSRSTTDGNQSLAPMMKLDSANRLILYNPQNPQAPPLIIDPAGKSHIPPQGDLSMGEFTHYPQ